MAGPDNEQAPATVAPPRPVRTALGLLLPLLGVLLVAALVLAAAAGGVRWLLLNDEGSRWLLSRLPLVQVQGFKGALLGSRWQIDRLRVPWSGGKAWVLLEDVRAEGLRWQWRPDAHTWLAAQADTLQARRVEVQTGPPGPRPVVLPADWAPPLRVAIGKTRADEFQLDAIAPWKQVAIDDFVMDPAPQGVLSSSAVAFETNGLAIAGAVRIGHAAPMPLAASASVRPLIDGDTPRWAAVLEGSGSVAQLQLKGTLRGVPVAVQPNAGSRAAAPVAREAPQLDLQARLQPLQAWLLAGLSLQTQSLDLAALWPRAPSTRLSGQAELQGGAQGTPLTATVALDNAQPGRWNEGRLPIQKVAIDARGELARPDRLDVPHFDIALADATRGAGRWTGSAQWLGHELKLDTRLAAVTPQRLDGRAAGMTLNGPVTLTLRGLPSPDFRSQPPTPTPPQALRWKLDLDGQLDAAPQPVQLQLEGEFDDEHLAFTVARAKSGAASADLKAALSRVKAGGWQFETTGKVLDFDPVVWLPGDVGSAWRKGPHRLSGEWQLDARLPANADRLAPLVLAQRVAGNGKLNIRDSQLAGVPLAAELVLGYSQAAAPQAGTLRADLRLGGNQLLLDARGDPTGNGQADRGRIELKADNLATLAPLLRLEPALAAWLPRQGQASAVVSAQGRWPALQTEGTARLMQLQLGTLSLARGAANWTLDMRGDQRAEQPLSLQLDLAGAQMGKQRADNLHAELQGTLGNHRIDVSGALPIAPPQITEQLLGIELQSGTRVQMQAQGAWRGDVAGGGRWAARIAQLQVGSWDGSPDSGASASGWAQARDLRAELRFDAQGQLAGIQAEPGRLRLAETATLRWDKVQIELQGDTPGAQPQIQLHADVEPFAVAPLLARAQPSMGWRGDLRVGARLDIRAAEKVDADLVFERADGDLHAVSNEGVRLLGLTEFRLALAAHEGVWNFTQTLRGRSLGEIVGELRVQTTPQARWPAQDAPISGKVQLRVADIGIWGSWVPPGWHLGGEVRASAELGGTFGQAQYTGAIAGTGLGVRNLLEGVNVSDGNVVIKLAGSSAEIETFTLKGGDGKLTVTGGATFGTAPQARLQVQAERFRVLGRVDRQLVASGKAELALQPEQNRLEGQFRVDEGLFDASRSDAPRLDDDVAVRRPGRSDDDPVDARVAESRKPFVLALTLDVGDRLRVRGRGLDTTLGGQVRVSNPQGRLAVNGTISTVGGSYVGYGQKMDIERGIVAFSGSADNPRLDILALRPNLDTRVGVSITGNAQTPRIRLFSEPDLSDSDKLAWLFLGRAPDGLGRNDTALLQRAALALLSGEGEAPTDALLKSLGIDELTLRQGDTDVRETVISLSKQLSRRWSVGYERGVNATTGTWQLVYRIAQRFTLRAQSGLDNSLDVIWTWRTQETPADAANRKVTLPAAR